MRMRLRRRGRSRLPSKHLTISATDDEWETVRSHATRGGQSIARYLVGLAPKDAEDGNDEPPLVLDAAQQREIYNSVTEVRALLQRADRKPSLLGAIEVRIEELIEDMMKRENRTWRHMTFIAASARRSASSWCVVIFAFGGRQHRMREGR